MLGRDRFDEAAYLAANPDVAAAVAAGAVRSGYAHYRRFGRREGRSLAPRETRRGRLLAGLDIAASAGLEIGPLDKPLVRKGEGDIAYVDHAAAADLRRHYQGDPRVRVDQIVEVDGVWGEKTLAEAVGPGKRFDYVLASHVIEHVPDLVAWLAEIHAVLKPGGSLRLAVPDKRFSFDYARDPSRLCDVLDAYLRRARAPLPRMILDHCLAARRVHPVAAWQGPLDISSLPPLNSPEKALAAARDAFERGTYHDVHCWVFTPASFASLMADLARMGLVAFSCRSLADTIRDTLEFFVIMTVSASTADMVAGWEQAAERLARADERPGLRERIRSAWSLLLSAPRPDRRARGRHPRPAA
jgi:SAM-dependent methyltransferase